MGAGMATLLLKRLLKHGFRLLVALTCLLSLTACTSLFFYPMKPWVQNPANQGLDYQDIVLIQPDGLRLSGWWLPATAPLKGTVYYLHGNAQNISTHVMNVGWLPQEGYQVFLLDYRGYGLSDGKPSLEGALNDIQAGLDWLDASGRLQQKPLIVFGQSLGASMSAWVLAQPDNRSKADCFIEEAGFADYKDEVNAVMKQSWLLWPLRPLVVPFINNHHAPEKIIHQLAPMPLMVLHSRDDKVVPFAHGERLFAAALEPKTFVTVDGSHGQAVQSAATRQQIMQFMQHCTSGPEPAALTEPVKQQWHF